MANAIFKIYNEGNKSYQLTMPKDSKLESLSIDFLGINLHINSELSSSVGNTQFNITVFYEAQVQYHLPLLGCLKKGTTNLYVYGDILKVEKPEKNISIESL